MTNTPLYVYRSGAYQQVGEIQPEPDQRRGLPPAPSWETLSTYVGDMLREVVSSIDQDLIATDFPSRVLMNTKDVTEELYATMAKRGEEYGEEVICALGEEAMIIMVLSKIMRLMWSHQNGKEFKERRDSWIDMAGYAALAVALDEYMRDES